MFFHTKDNHPDDDDDDDVPLGPMGAASSNVLSASSWKRFQQQQQQQQPQQGTDSKRSESEAPPPPPAPPTLLRQPTHTFSVDQSKLLYQDETHISKWLDPYLCVLWCDEYIQHARYASAILHDEGKVKADAQQLAHSLRAEFHTHIAFLQRFLMLHYRRLIQTKPLRLATGDPQKWDDVSKAPKLSAGHPDTPYGVMELKDAKMERAAEIERTRTRLMGAATANNQTFDAHAYDEEDYLDIASHEQVTHSTVKQNPLSQLGSLKTQPVMVSNRDIGRTRPYTCDLICTIMYAIAHMEASLMHGELNLYHLERELTGGLLPSADGKPAVPLHVSWNDHLTTLIQTAQDFSYTENLDRFYTALLRFKTQLVHAVVWDDICAVQDIYARLQAGARIYTWYMLQHELLNGAQQPLPLPAIPARWKRKFREYMRGICTRSREYEFELKFAELVYDHELRGNEAYRYVLEHEQAELDMASREIIIGTWQESDMRAMYTEIQKDRLAILENEQNPLRLHLMVMIFEECFIQSMHDYSFLKHYFITHRQFFERYTALQRVWKTEEPYVERRPVILCLLGKWVLWKGTKHVYVSNDMEELLLTWLYLIDQEYDGVLDIRETSINGVMRTLGIGRLPRAAGLRLDGDREEAAAAAAARPLTDND